MRIPLLLARSIAKAKPLVPSRMWPAILAARSMAGAGPVLALPSYRRVLVLAAHPDDESMGCAGTIALLAQSGARVDVVYASDGEATRGSGSAPDVTAAARRSEAEQACRLLGAQPPRFLGSPDGRLAESVPELATAVRAVLAQLQPQVVLVPWFLDAHRDHQSLTEVLADAGLADDVEVWGFEVWTPLPPTRLVDVTTVVETKRAALALHVTAHQAFDIGVAMGLSRWRSVHAQLGQGYAEAFLAAPASEYLRLATQALGEIEEKQPT
jgi:LmbE family N-acetylglucosaminyl deacetylase